MATALTSDRPPRLHARRSLGTEATDAVRDMILTGRLRPGVFVTHEQIASLLGVSIMPAREAIQRLSHEGLIDESATRRHRVAMLTRDDIRDIYWMHGTLAGELTRRVCARRDRTVIADLEEIQEAWSAALSTGSDSERLDHLNHRFHATINRAAGAPQLVRNLRQTLRLIPQRFYALLPTWPSVSTRGHDEIVNAVRHGRVTAARNAARDHVYEAGALLIASFIDSGYWESPEDGERRRDHP